MDNPQNIGAYRVVRPLGKGGMGEVYEVVDVEGRHLALKLFSADHGAVDFLRQRFRAEGALLAQLNHPRLVRVRETGIDGTSGRPYYVMDLVHDAADRVVTLETAREARDVTEEKAEDWYADLVAALAYCHTRGVVHRDVKLENVLIDATGHAVLSDFGVSRICDRELREAVRIATTFVTGETAGTRPVMGTYWYLAPELRQGEPATSASDWYALGVLFFRLLTGMWYEPGTNALDLLAPCAPHWHDRIARLLSDEPAVRTPPCPGGPRSVAESPYSRAKRFRLVSAILLSVIVVCAITFWRTTGSRVARTRPDSITLVRHRPYSSDRPALVFDASNRFEFCACPVGTNAYYDVAVAVTHPYWLGRTPVTRRQWFAVCGEALAAWPGGEDAPMTYVTRAEMTDFCARLNRCFARVLPPGYGIRLPTLAEWRLAFERGGTPGRVLAVDEKSRRRTADALGWFGQGPNGEAKFSNMFLYYNALPDPVPFVTNIWRAFPPRVLRAGQDEWMRYSSRIPPVPVGLKPADDLGLHDMFGNCLECVVDTCSEFRSAWGRTEWGMALGGLYAGQGNCVTNPVERSGAYPVMIGNYMAPDTILADRPWSADFDRLPHLGFRLCIAPL